MGILVIADVEIQLIAQNRYWRFSLRSKFEIYLNWFSAVGRSQNDLNVQKWFAFGFLETAGTSGTSTAKQQYNKGESKCFHVSTLKRSVNAVNRGVTSLVRIWNEILQMS